MYEIFWEEKALDELEKLDKSISLRIYKKVNSLKSNFDSLDIKKIKATDFYRLRVGDYRVVFSSNQNKIIILKIGHRKKIYKSL